MSGRSANALRWCVPFFVTGVLLALLLRDGDAIPVEAAPPDAASASAAAGFPRRVAWPDGTVVELRSAPTAVVAAAGGSIDLLVALHTPERTAALPEPALAWSVLHEERGAWGHVPVFTRYLAEPILALRPDLVLVHDWQDMQTTSRLREAGVPVVVLTDPRTWDEARAQIRQVARLLGAEDRAEAVLRRYEDVLSRIEHPEPAPTALCVTHGGAGGWVAGAGTTNHEMLRLAGVRNLAAEVGRTGHGSLTFEELLHLDPEWLVVPASRESGLSTREVLLSEPALATLRAVRDHRIVEIDGWLYTTTSHHLVDGAAQLAERLLARAR